MSARRHLNERSYPKVMFHVERHFLVSIREVAFHVEHRPLRRNAVSRGTCILVSRGTKRAFHVKRRFAFECGNHSNASIQTKTFERRMGFEDECFVQFCGYRAAPRKRGACGCHSNGRLRWKRGQVMPGLAKSRFLTRLERRRVRNDMLAGLLDEKLHVGWASGSKMRCWLTSELE